MRRLKLMLIIMMMFIILCSYQTRSYADDFQTNRLANKLQQGLDKKVKELEVPGIQASVRVNDDYWFSASGSVDFEKEKKLTTKHSFRIGSVTKIFTAAIIMKLYENGEINLDDKINKWFPEFPKSDIVNVRQLLNHSSGIYNYTENLWFNLKTVLFSKKIWNPNTLLKSTYNKQFYFTPGDSHLYSNTNYLMLGLIIEKLTGESLAKIYRKHIFEPFELKNTFFVPYEKIPENLITGYDRDIISFGIQEYTSKENSFATYGFSAGAIVSTSEDLRRWIDNLFKSDFISQDTLNEMKQYLKANDPDVREQVGYGLGLRVLEICGDKIYGHTGTIPGFGAAVFYCPDKDYSIAVVSNISMFAQIDVLKELISIINEHNVEKKSN
jgi:D-alanyl-D-alanine carboxypeptidase